MYKFFVRKEQLKDNIIEIIDDDVNHIKNVLRLGKNEKIEISDISNSNNYLSRIIELNNMYIKCEIIKKLENSKETSIYLHIFQGLPKSEKLENIIQKTTEIGISEITPVIMNRCVAKLEEKSIPKKIQRWQKIAEVAAKQSKRDKIPLINNPISIKNIYEKVLDYDIVIVAYENEENSTIKNLLRNIKYKENIKIAIIIGPEGGLEQEEVNYISAHEKVAVVSLGKRILRTETAPIVMSSVIMYEFGEMD